MQEGNPTCCESPASIKGGSHNAGTLKETSETREKVYKEAAQNHIEQERTRRTEQRESDSEQGKWTEVHRDCKARSQPDWRQAA